MAHIPKILLWCALLELVLLLVAPLIYRLGLGGLGPSFMLLQFSAGLGVLIALASVVASVWFKTKGLGGSGLMRTALVLALVPVGVVGVQVLNATSVPPIHDISTDWNDPPQYVRILKLRSASDNTLAVNEDVVRTQRAAYPDLSSPLVVADAPSEALENARKVALDMGLTEVNYTSELGYFEAVARTLWFGFRDDFIVRVRPVGQGSKLDIRSASRVGVSDLGKNADRIREFIERYNSIHE